MHAQSRVRHARGSLARRDSSSGAASRQDGGSPGGRRLEDRVGHDLRESAYLPELAIGAALERGPWTARRSVVGSARAGAGFAALAAGTVGSHERGTAARTSCSR
jgi:hypothetical protein